MGLSHNIVFLVVDDSKISRKWLIEMIPKKILEHATIIEATNGQEAIDLYKAHHPDIVFLDFTMPVVDKLYIDKRLFPFFEGLIPEGWLLDIATKNWKLNLWGINV